jgi:hypothetical protein
MPDGGTAFASVFLAIVGVVISIASEIIQAADRKRQRDILVERAKGKNAEQWDAYTKILKNKFVESPTKKDTNDSLH